MILTQSDFQLTNAPLGGGMRRGYMQCQRSPVFTSTVDRGAVVEWRQVSEEPSTFC